MTNLNLGTLDLVDLRELWQHEERNFTPWLAENLGRLGAVLDMNLNQYQGGMCISGRLTMTERTPRHLISPLGPNWVGTDSAV